MNCILFCSYFERAVQVPTTHFNFLVRTLSNCRLSRQMARILSSLPIASKEISDVGIKSLRAKVEKVYDETIVRKFVKLSRECDKPPVPYICESEKRPSLQRFGKHWRAFVQQILIIPRRLVRELSWSFIQRKNNNLPACIRTWTQGVTLMVLARWNYNITGIFPLNGGCRWQYTY